MYMYVYFSVPSFPLSLTVGFSSPRLNTHTRGSILKGARRRLDGSISFIPCHLQPADDIGRDFPHESTGTRYLH